MFTRKDKESESNDKTIASISSLNMPVMNNSMESKSMDGKRTPTSAEIRKLVKNARIPVHVIYNGHNFFKMVSRFSYFDSLATTIMRNNSCNFEVFYRSKEGNMIRCDLRYTIGICYDMIDPDTLPWKLDLNKLPGERRDIQKMHMNVLKHSHYLEYGNVTHLSNLSKSQYVDIQRDMLNEIFECPHVTLNSNGQNNPIATRIHFSDGSSLVRKMCTNDSVYGIIQGILVSHVRAGDITYLKNVDNWLHICLPNAKASIQQYINKDKITITFRSVGSTPMITKNIIKISSLSTIAACGAYILKKLGSNVVYNSTKLQFYLDGLFLVDEQESIYNLTLDDSDRLSLYYSIGDAWL